VEGGEDVKRGKSFKKKAAGPRRDELPALKEKPFAATDLAALSCLLLLILVAYLQVLDFDFLNYDDIDYVLGNEMVSRGLS